MEQETKNHRVSSSLLRIGQLAERCQKTVRALHLYEEMGLLVPRYRTKGGFRLYDPGAVERVRWINRLQEAELSLTQIKEFLQEISKERIAKNTMHRLEGMLKKRLDEVKEQKRKLDDLEKDLTLGLTYLKSCQVCEPERTSDECGSCRLHGHTGEPPLLIAGLHSPEKVANVQFTESKQIC